MITHLIAMYNVFSVHWEIFSTSGGGGGGDGGYHGYIGEISLFSTLGDAQYIGWIS